MNGGRGGQNKQSGSVVLEVSLWSFLMVITIAVLHQKYEKGYRGFLKAIHHQSRMLLPIGSPEVSPSSWEHFSSQR
jgi:hypothetical protein